MQCLALTALLLCLAFTTAYPDVTTKNGFSMDAISSRDFEGDPGVLSSVGNTLNNVAEDLTHSNIGQGAQEFGSSVKDMASGTGETIGNAANNMANINIGQSAQEFGNSVKNIWNDAGNIFSNAFGDAKDGVANIGDKIGGTFNDVKGAVSGAASDSVDFVKNINVGEGVNTLANGAAQTANDAWNSIGNSATVQAVSEFTQDASSKIGGTFNDVTGAVGGAASDSFNFVKNINVDEGVNNLANVSETANDAWKTLGNSAPVEAVSNFAQDASNNIGGTFNDMKGAVSGAASDSVNFVKNINVGEGVNNLANGVSQTANDGWNSVGDSAPVQSISDLTQDAASKVNVLVDNPEVQEQTHVLDDLSSDINSSMDHVVNPRSDPQQDLTSMADNANQLMSEASNTFNGLANDATSAAENIGQQSSDVAGNAVNNMGEMINNAQSQVNGAVEEVGNAAENVVNSTGTGQYVDAAPSDLLDQTGLPPVLPDVSEQPHNLLDNAGAVTDQVDNVLSDPMESPDSLIDTIKSDISNAFGTAAPGAQLATSGISATSTAPGTVVSSVPTSTAGSLPISASTAGPIGSSTGATIAASVGSSTIGGLPPTSTTVPSTSVSGPTDASATGPAVSVSAATGTSATMSVASSNETEPTESTAAPTSTTEPKTPLVGETVPVPEFPVTNDCVFTNVDPRSSVSSEAYQPVGYSDDCQGLCENSTMFTCKAFTWAGPGSYCVLHGALNKAMVTISNGSPYNLTDVDCLNNEGGSTIKRCVFAERGIQISMNLNVSTFKKHKAQTINFCQQMCSMDVLGQCTSFGYDPRISFFDGYNCVTFHRSLSQTELPRGSFSLYENPCLLYTV